MSAEEVQSDLFTFRLLRHTLQSTRLPSRFALGRKRRSHLEKDGRTGGSTRRRPFEKKRDDLGCSAVATSVFTPPLQVRQRRADPVTSHAAVCVNSAAAEPLQVTLGRDLALVIAQLCAQVVGTGLCAAPGSACARGLREINELSAGRGGFKRR